MKYGRKKNKIELVQDGYRINEWKAFAAFLEVSTNFLDVVFKMNRDPSRIQNFIVILFLVVFQFPHHMSVKIVFNFQPS